MTGPVHHSAKDPASLATLRDGQRARLVAVEGGTRLRTRLLAMGLRPGAEVRVVRNGGRGPFVLALDHMRIVLGRGMAGQIRVALVSGAAPPSK
jgi:ferrous iron transport protein A